MRPFIFGLLLASSSLATEVRAKDDEVIAVAASAVDLAAFTAQVLRGPQAAAIAAATERAGADVEGTGLWANPALRLERQSGPLDDQTSGSQDFAVFEVPLSPGGHHGLEREAARQRLAAASLDARQQRAALAREAADVFIDVVIARRRLRALEGERAEIAHVVAVARQQVTAGEAAAARALRLELELAHLDDDIAAAGLMMSSSRRRAAALVDGAVPDFIDALPSSASDPGLVAPSAGVRSLEQRAIAARTAQTAAERRVIPDVVVAAGPSLLQTGSPEMAVGYLVSLEVGLPVFDRGQGDAARARAEEGAWRAEAAAETRRLEVRRLAARERRDSAVARSAAFAKAVDNAVALKAAVASDLAVGSGDVVVYVDTVRALRAATQHTLTLQAEVARAAVDLAFVHGALDGSSESP